MLFRSVFVWCVFASLTQSASAVTPASTTSPPPNFLFVAIDDLNTFNGYSAEEPGNFLQVIYPDVAVRAQVVARLTPNLDRLAKNSAPFLRSYCHSALCGPSRTALLTGVPAHRSGYYNHTDQFRLYPTLQDAVTLPQLLKQNGYFTTGLGKIFHKSSGTVDGPLEDDWADARNSWTQWINRPTGCNGGTKSKYSPPDGGLMSFGPSRLKSEEAADYENADFAARLLLHGTAATPPGGRNRDGPTETITLPENHPFFLAVGLFRPHLPFHAPQSFFDQFPTAEMSGLNRANLDAIIADLKDIPPDGMRFSDFGNGKMKTLMENARKIGGAEGEIAAWRELVQAYLACVSFADTCIGRIVEGYEKSPHYDNTVLVLWSDHGYHLGSKYHVAKQALWETANNTVLLLRDPRNPATLDGQPRRQIVGLTDLYPTIATLAGVTPPAHNMGTDLTPLLNDPSAPEVRSAYLMTYQEGNHAVRTATHSLMRYRDGGIELYDDLQDPHQLYNLAGQASYAQLQSTLIVTLDELTRGEILAPQIKRGPTIKKNHEDD